MSKISIPEELTDGRPKKFIYQVYTPTFADSNGDGIGDLPGITKRVGYIAHLGVDAIMLGPVHPSPDDPAKSDGWYSVTNHRDIHPKYGTVEDFDKLVATAGRKGIGIIMDPVICHTSCDHQWFEKSRRREGPYTDFYVWHPGKVYETGEDWAPKSIKAKTENDRAKQNGEEAKAEETKPEAKRTRVEPNNWLSCFGGSAWTLDPVRDEYYLHHFGIYQPALNLILPKVQDALFGELLYWKERYANTSNGNGANTGNGSDNSERKIGVIGIRSDAASFAVCNPDLKNDDWLYGWPNNKAVERWTDQYHSNSICQPEAVKVFQRMREKLGNDFFLLGEVIAGPRGGDDELPVAASYRGAFTSSYTKLSTPFVFDDARTLRGKAATNKYFFPDDSICWGTGTHDIARIVNRLENLPQGDLRAVALRQEMIRIFTEPGDKILYNFDELGIPQAAVATNQRKDINPNGESRDPERVGGAWVNKPWRKGAQNGGFTTSDKPWLPVPTEYLPLAAAAQEHCERSNLRFMVNLIHWAKEQPALVKGQTFYLDNDGDVYGRVHASKTQTMLMLFNRSAREVTINVNDYLSEGLVKKLGLESKTNITIAPFEVEVAEAQSNRPTLHSAKRPTANISPTASCKNCSGSCFGGHGGRQQIPPPQLVSLGVTPG